jgi:hypothetical protein
MPTPQPPANLPGVPKDQEQDTSPETEKTDPASENKSTQSIHIDRTTTETRTYDNERVEKASKWGVRRKATLLGIFVAIALVVIGILLVPLLMPPEPTCSDGKENGDENGIDCGGVCQKICLVDVSQPQNLWTNSFTLGTDAYAAVAYFRNPSDFLEAYDPLTYTFLFYDEGGNVIHKQPGKIDVPRRANFAIFEGPVLLDVEPARVVLQYTTPNTWLVSDEVKQQEVLVENESISVSEQFPQAQAIITNTTFEEKEDIPAVAIVYDARGNAIAASQTIVPLLPGEGRVPIQFSWLLPIRNSSSVRECRVPTNIALVIDRSGSMNDDSENPPEPLSTVKEAAKVFTQSLGEQDKVSVISFATSATLVAPLSQPSLSTQGAISQISIQEDETTQHTNIADGVSAAIDSVRSVTSTDERKAIVLLTDGVASRPLGPEEDNEVFPRERALEQAVRARSGDIELFTIGLGDDVDFELLRTMTDETRAYLSPTVDELEGIYNEIASSLCIDDRAYVEVIPLAD